MTAKTRFGKWITLCAFGVFASTWVACGGGSTDAKEVADSTNTSMVDSAKKADTVPAENSHAADLKDDAAFAVSVADAGQLEVDLGKIAAEKGLNKQVKAFGAMMVKDHTKASKELKSITDAKNITLPAALSDKCQKIKDDLSAKTGAEFDKAYADQMVSDHKSVIDDFEKEIDNGKDSAIKHFAVATLPTLKHHLTMAEDAQKATSK